MGVGSLHRTPITHSARAKDNPQAMVNQNHSLTVKVRAQTSLQARAAAILSAVVDVSLRTLYLKNFMHTILKT
jgi:hypothetical protein